MNVVAGGDAQACEALRALRAKEILRMSGISNLLIEGLGLRV